MNRLRLLVSERIVDTPQNLCLAPILRPFKIRSNIPDSQIRATCCHFAVTYSAFNFTKLKPRCFHKLSIVLSRKVFLRIQQTVSCHHAYIACRQFAVNMTSLLFLNVYSYNFVNSWNLFALLMLTQFTLDFNDSKLSTSWKQYMQYINLFHMLNLAWLSGMLVSSLNIKRMQMFYACWTRKFNSLVISIWIAIIH